MSVCDIVPDPDTHGRHPGKCHSGTLNVSLNSADLIQPCGGLTHLLRQSSERNQLQIIVCGDSPFPCCARRDRTGRSSPQWPEPQPNSGI